MTKYGVTIIALDGEKTRSAAAKVEGLALARRALREPIVVGGEYV